MGAGALVRALVQPFHMIAHGRQGGISLRDWILQRCYRDIHSGTQHIFLADQILEDCGRVLVGATDKKTQWNVLGISKD